MSYFSTVSTQFADSGSIDAFSRMRISPPAALFDAQFTYNLVPLVFEQITNGAGATIAHDSTNRCALMTFSGTATGGKAFMQSYEYVPYQPGKSQLAFITFNMIETKTDVLKFAGLSDGSNGIEFQLDGSTKKLAILSDTSSGDEIISQSSWNLDKLDGTGVSGLTLDITKTQILVIDFQALFVGRVRVGFDINGKVYYAHEFNHANRSSFGVYPYIQYASLPVRCGMTCTGTVSTTMNFICSSVAAEGGDSNLRGYTFSTAASATASSGVRTHLLSVRPKTTFNSIANHIKFELDGVNVLVTGNSPILWELCLGAAFSVAPTYADVDSTYSGFEAGTAGTYTAPGSPLVIASGFCGSGTGGNTGTQLNRLNSKYPITLDQAGAQRALGTLSLLVTGLGGNSACRGSLQWREIR